jgi:hypothetical protein
MTQMSDTVDLVREVVRDLSEGGFQVAALGGWGDDLLGASPPRMTSTSTSSGSTQMSNVLMPFVAGRDEIAEKRFSHKRAFMAGRAVFSSTTARPRSGRGGCGPRRKRA